MSKRKPSRVPEASKTPFDPKKKKVTAQKKERFAYRRDGEKIPFKLSQTLKTDPHYTTAKHESWVFGDLFLYVRLTFYSGASAYDRETATYELHKPWVVEARCNRFVGDRTESHNHTCEDYQDLKDAEKAYDFHWRAFSNMKIRFDLEELEDDSAQIEDDTPASETVESFGSW